MLYLKNVSIKYNGINAVNDIFINAAENNITTLIGANGAGKTTILKAISGFIKITTGEILFDNIKIDGLRPDKIVNLGITQVPEGRGLFPYMSVLDNLLTGSHLRKDIKNIKSDIEEVYDYFPVLKKMRKKLARNMSGGEQQMVAIGRALMASPKLYLFDEPSIGLAPIIVQEVIKTIKKISIEKKCSVLLVEQNANLAIGISDKVYVLELGKIVLEGSSDELKNNIDVKKAYLGA